MKNILVLTPTLSGGGAERSTAIITKYLSSNYNVTIATYQKNGQEYDYNGELVNLNIPTDTSNPIKRLIIFFKRWHVIKRLKIDREINLTISNLENANLLNILTRKHSKTILTMRSFKSQRVNGIKGKIYKFLISNLYNRSDKIVAVSKAVKQDLERNFDLDQNKISVLYNGIDIQNIQEEMVKEVEEKYIPFNKSLITVGSLNKHKGHWHLIRAFEKVLKSNPKLHLVIVGDGPLKKELKELANELNIESHVHFLGRKNNPYKYMYQSKLFIFTSITEGFGNVLVESMACETPVISTDCNAGPKEILTNDKNKNNIDRRIGSTKVTDYGILVPPFSGTFLQAHEELISEELELVESIEYLLKNKTLYENYKHVIKQRAWDFDVKLKEEEWLKLVSKVLR